mmetsp:Transcript_27736/g.39694  ORF Transcript_27736/g.39694 Transcript_27736/m.39694 type:complete len:139 (+) Transcript_27736:54-470(+)
MKKRIISAIVLLVPCASSFIANPKVSTSVLATTRKPSSIFLHVQQIHDHRDTLVKLDDPIMSIKDASVQKDKRIHNFTNHIAPIVLALYFIGHFLNNYHAPLMDDHIPVDPMFGGGILIGVGLYLLNSSIDATFLSPS